VYDRDGACEGIAARDGEEARLGALNAGIDECRDGAANDGELFGPDVTVRDGIDG